MHPHRISDGLRFSFSGIFLYEGLSCVMMLGVTVFGRVISSQRYRTELKEYLGIQPDY